MMKKVVVIVIGLLLWTVPVLAWLEASGVETPPPMPVAEAEPDVLDFVPAAELNFSAEPYRVVQQGDYAYVGRLGELLVLDVTQQPIPEVIVTATLAISQPVAMAVMGDVLYVSTGCELRPFDITRPTMPVAAAPVPLLCANGDGWRGATEMQVAEPFIYVNHYNGISVLDASAPLRPAVVSHYEQLDDGAYTFDVVDELLYLFGDNAAYVIDATDVASPTLLHQFDDLPRTHRVAIEENYAYVLRDHETLTIFDISDPAALVSLGEVVLPRNRYDHWPMTVVGEYVYVANSASVLAIDVADKSAPYVAGESVVLPRINDFSLIDGRAIVASQGGVYTLELPDPTTLTLTAHWAQFSNLYMDLGEGVVVDEYWYVPHRLGQLYIFDVSSPDVITPTAVLYTPYTTAVAVAGDYVYVVGETGWMVVDVSTPALPRVVYWLAVEAGVAHPLVGDNRLYLAMGAELVQLDITNGAVPVEMARYGLDDDITDMTWFEDYVAVTDGSGVLTLLDVSGVVPVRVSETAVVGYPRAVAGGAGMLYVIGGNGLLNVIDVASAAGPRVENVYLTYKDGWRAVLRDLTWRDSRLYVRDDRAGVVVLDVRDPSQIIEASRIDWGERTPLLVDERLYVVGDVGLYAGELIPSIRGKVRDRARNPVAGVRMRQNDLLSSEQIITDELGDYHFEALSWARQSVQLAEVGYTAAPATHVLTTTQHSFAKADFVIVPIAEVVSVTATMSQTVGYEGIRGQSLQLFIPAGSVETAVALALTPTTIQTPVGLRSSGHSFRLAADVSVGADVPISALMTVTLSYDEADLRLMADKAGLALYRWQDGDWAEDGCGGTLQHDLEANVIVATLCQQGDYAFLGQTYSSFLPIALSDRAATLPVEGAVQLLAVHSGKCLQGGEQWTCNQSPTLTAWQPISVAETLVQLRQVATNECLTILPSAPYGMTMMMACDAVDVAQQWAIEDVGDYVRIVSAVDGECLDILAASIFDARPAILWPCTGTQNQLWYVEDY